MGIIEIQRKAIKPLIDAGLPDNQLSEAIIFVISAINEATTVQLDRPMSHVAHKNTVAGRPISGLTTTIKATTDETVAQLASKLEVLLKEQAKLPDPLAGKVTQAFVSALDTMMTKTGADQVSAKVSR